MSRVCMYVCLSIYWFVNLSVCLLVWIFVCLFVCSSVSLSVCPSVCICMSHLGLCCRHQNFVYVVCVFQFVLLWLAVAYSHLQVETLPLNTKGSPLKITYKTFRSFTSIIAKIVNAKTSMILWCTSLNQVSVNHDQQRYKIAYLSKFCIIICIYFLFIFIYYLFIIIICVFIIYLCIYFYFYI